MPADVLGKCKHATAVTAVTTSFLWSFETQTNKSRQKRTHHTIGMCSTQRGIALHSSTLYVCTYRLSGKSLESMHPGRQSRHGPQPSLWPPLLTLLFTWLSHSITAGGTVSFRCRRGSNFFAGAIFRSVGFAIANQ